MLVGRYDFIPVTVNYWRDTGKKRLVKKTGELKPILIPVLIRYIWVSIPGSDYPPWAFVGTRRDGVYRYSDQRNKTTQTGGKPKSMTEAQLEAEISRLAGSPSAGLPIVAAMISTVVDRDEYAALIGAEVRDVLYDDGSTKTVIVGGLPEKAQDAAASVKARVALDKSVLDR